MDIKILMKNVTMEISPVGMVAPPFAGWNRAVMDLSKDLRNVTMAITPLAMVAHRTAD
jgi:hypothetical protein